VDLPTEEPTETPAAAPAGAETAVSPALVNLLVHSGRLTGDALAATVVDLAARGHVHLEQIAPGEVLARFDHRPRADDELQEHERQALDLLRGRAIDGVVPVGALGQGVTGESDRWWGRFRHAVEDEGDARRLLRGISPLPDLLALLAALLFIGALGAAALVDDAAVATVLVGAGITVAFGLMMSIDGATGRALLTPEGVSLGSRWIAEREQVLDLLPDDLGPAAVTVRGRTLAFAAAVGTAPSVTRGLPRGPDSVRDAWVRRGGIWRRVRLRYPVRLPRGWGRPPVTTILPSLVGVVGAWSVLWFTRTGAQPLLDGAAIVLLLVAGWELLGGLYDVATSPRAIRGPVAARRLVEGACWNPWRDLVPRRWYVVVDDGRSSTLRGLRVSEDAFHKAHRGDIVSARVGRAQGFVHEIEIEHPGRG
jgi:hypothetical protein